MRSNNLKEGIKNLLNDPDGVLTKDDKLLTERFYEHPLIKRLAKQGWFDKVWNRESKPSYIPSRDFALALLDIIAPVDFNAESKVFKDVRDAVTKLSDSEIKKALLVLIDEASGDLKKVRDNIENWFDDAMDRVSGWYARKAQLITLFLALVVTVLLNADTIMIANSLSQDAALRATVIATAGEYIMQTTSAETESNKDPSKKINEIRSQLQLLQLPIGWSPKDKDANDTKKSIFCYLRAALPSDSPEWFSKIAGLFITTMAVSLGAPFWFDILNKIVNLRSVGKKPQPEKSPKTTPEQ